MEIIIGLYLISFLVFLTRYYLKNQFYIGIGDMKLKEFKYILLALYLIFIMSIFILIINDSGDTISLTKI